VLVACIIRPIALMMKAVNTSETSVNFYRTTWHNNREDKRLYNYTFGFYVWTILFPFSGSLWSEGAVNKVLKKIFEMK
jgi:hypothetical protein